MEEPDPRDRRPALLSHPLAKEAWTLLTAMDPWILDRQMELTAIPAPPFQEAARGRRMAELFREVGLGDVRIDGVGNVRGGYGGADGDMAPLILSAHLDTVFPPGTDVTPTRDGPRIRAPGICDDGRGLAALLGLAKAVVTLGLPLPFPLVFVATVGEEGAGNLRGVRYLLSDGEEVVRPRGFISLDGTGLDRIIHRGVGSTRLRITLLGPGGHSWANFSRPNPIHSLGHIVSRAHNLPLPTDPKTTLTVARWGGGTSINAIPQDAWVEVDLRSEGGKELEFLEEELMGVLADELPGVLGGDTLPYQLSFQVEEIGRRPPGSTDPSHPLVAAAVDATRNLGVDPKLVSSSTDANVPMALGIPAITLGAGGAGGGIHSLAEWYENRKGPEGVLRALLIPLLLSE